MIRNRSKPWSVKDFGLLALMLGVGAWAFRSPLSDILHVATRDPEQSHILLAPLVMAWLVYLRRPRLHLIRVCPNLIGSLIVLAGCALSWFGFQTDVYIAWHAGALLALLGMLLSLTGFEPLRLYSSAALALAFMLPVPGTIRQAIAIPLQAMATTVTQECLQLFGYQATRLGNVLLLNGQQIAVAEACNGMRLVFSLTLVVYAFAFSVPLKPSMRILLLVASPLVALVVNVIRLIPTSLLYGTTTAHQAEMFHNLSGWFMLPIALVGMIGALHLMKWLELPVFSYRLANQ